MGVKHKKSRAKMHKKTKRKVTRSKSRQWGNEDTQQRRKYARGGRIEAYTMGEALGNKDWP